MELHPSLSSSISLTRLMHHVQQGRETIHSPELQRVYDVWLVMLTRVANRIISQKKQRGVGPEDVASEVVWEFLKDLEQDPAKVRFQNRQDVWRQLKRRVRNHALNQIRYEEAQIRGGGDVAGESAMGAPNAPFNPAGIGQFPDHRKDEDDYDEDSEYRLERELLLREIAENYPTKQTEMLAIATGLLDLLTPKEIINLTGYSQSSVYRKIEMIREVWKQDFVDDTAST